MLLTSPSNPVILAHVINDTLGIQECNRLKGTRENHTQGALALLAKSEAEVEELSARLKLQETQSTRELALANKEVMLIPVVSECPAES